MLKAIAECCKPLQNADNYSTRARGQAHFEATPQNACFEGLVGETLSKQRSSARAQNDVEGSEMPTNNWRHIATS
eukprot:6730871-Lingulodinium_polyedra.AAC.1